MNIKDFQTYELINELRERGYTILDDVEKNEFDVIIGEANAIIALVHVLDSAIIAENAYLQLKTVESLLYMATGEAVSLEQIVPV